MEIEEKEDEGKTEIGACLEVLKEGKEEIKKGKYREIEERGDKRKRIQK